MQERSRQEARHYCPHQLWSQRSHRETNRKQQSGPISGMSKTRCVSACVSTITHARKFRNFENYSLIWSAKDGGRRARGRELRQLWWVWGLRERLSAPTGDHEHLRPLHARAGAAAGRNCTSRCAPNRTEQGDYLPSVVYGVLLGTQKGRSIDICNSFELVVGGEHQLDREYFTSKEEQCKCPNPQSGRPISRLDTHPPQSSRCFPRWSLWGGTPLESIQRRKTLSFISRYILYMRTIWLLDFPYVI